MRDDPIDAEIIEDQIVACPQCGQRNRLHPGRRKVGYRCGACRTELPNPFAADSRFSGVRSVATMLMALSKFQLALMASVVVAVALLVALMLSSKDSGTPQDSLNLIREADLHSRSPGQTNREAQPMPDAQASSTPRTLANGARITVLSSFGDGILRFENGTKLNAAVKVVDERARQTVVAFYVCAGQAVSIERIPDGVYRVVVASGTDWDAATRKFTRDQSFARFDAELKFATTMQPNGRGVFSKQTAAFMLALGKEAPDGPKISAVSEEEFRKY
jgi:uncharacterized protein (DUF983 family)